MVVDVVRPSVDERVRAALWFAERGFGVFSVWAANDDGDCRCPTASKTRGADGRCSSPGKHPVTTNGFHDATTDPARIRSMLTTSQQPNYGIVPPPGVFALDVDDDGDGIGRLARLQALHGSLPPTLRTQTANGQHIFLRWPADLPRPVHKLYGYVTRWGSGEAAGYVIGPRSVHASGFVYAPMPDSFEIADLPDVWAQAALEGERSPRITVGGELPERGGRHDWLRDRARYYRGLIDDKAVLRAAMLAENARLKEPKTEAEVDRAIGEVFERFPLDPPATVEERVARRLGDDELDILGLSSSGEFPAPPDLTAFAGRLGEMVGALSNGTDASNVGLLGCLIAVMGAMVPGQAYFHRNQTSSPFIALVGESSIGRKGTAMNRVLDATIEALGVLPVNRMLLDGINSGEGLVAALARKQEAFPQEPTGGLIFEEEYATLIASRGREGSTLDSRMRVAFDGGSLSNRRSADQKVVRPPYWLPALVAITPSELQARVEAGSLQSGSTNRWLHLPVTRRLMEPTNEPPVFPRKIREDLIAANREAAERRPDLAVDPDVRRTLSEYADFCSAESGGLAGDLTKRFAVIAFRIALVHALVERSTVVGTGHLTRALALTEYARRGIPWVFGDTIGDRDAALLYRHLEDRGRLSTSAITRHVIRDPARRQSAIDELLRIRRARVVTVQTSGRSRRELEAVPASDALFAPFFHVPYLSQSETVKTVERVEEMEISAQEPWKEAGKKVEGSPESVVCSDYHGHQSRHVFRDGDWVCERCEGTR